MIDTFDCKINADYIDSTCAVMLCTYESRPKLIDYNEEMLEILTAENGNASWRSYLDEDIFYMIPFGEWNYFSEKIEKLISGSNSVLVRHRITRNDGVMIPVTGWINLYIDKNNEKRILLLYPEHNITQKNILEESSDPYITAIRNVYNLIFELNISDNTVCCIFAKSPYNSNPAFYSSNSISEFERLWINEFTHPDDRYIMKHFFEKTRSIHGQSMIATPCQTDFHSRGLALADLEQSIIAIPFKKNGVLLCISNIFYMSYNNPSYISDSSEEIDGRPGRGIFIRTFGHFDVFLDSVPIIFPNAKEKELLALLVDRRGGTLSSDEAVAILWEDEPISDKIRTRYRKLAMGLKRTLEKYDISDLVINNKGVRCINTKMVVCDYYEMIGGNEAYHRKFHNSYMSDYSWSETTLGTLWEYS